MDYYCPYAPGGICESYEPDLEDLLKHSEVNIDDAADE